MIPAPAHFRDLFEYVRWGDQQSLIAARDCEEGEYHREQGISHGSVHKLLVHMMAAQSLWLERFRGTSPTLIETAEQYPKRMDLEQRWPLVHAAMLDFVAHITPQALAKNINYKNTRGEQFCLPLATLMTHVIDHAAYHRGQLATMIRKAGGKPVQISYQVYANAKGRHW